MTVRNSGSFFDLGARQQGDDLTSVSQLVSTRRPLLLYAIIIQMIVGLIVAFAATKRAGGQERQTLLQWSYGTSFGGGPNLYGPLVTDRPDFTEASSTVGRGVAQLEMGYTFTQNDDAGVLTRSHSFPETLLRMGVLAEWFELRFDWNYAVERNDFGNFVETESGAEDLTLGVKLGLTPQEYILPETAIILQTSVPTGGDAFTSNDVLPGVNFLYGWDLIDDWSLGASTGLNPTVDDTTTDTYTEFSQSFTINHSWTKRIGSYCEWYVLSPVNADTRKAEHYLDGGVTTLISNDAQWDVRVGVGLNESADDFFAGTGLSIRYW